MRKEGKWKFEEWRKEKGKEGPINRLGLIMRRKVQGRDVVIYADNDSVMQSGKTIKEVQ